MTTEPADDEAPFGATWTPLTPEEMADPRRSWSRLAEEPPTWNSKLWPVTPGAQPEQEVLLVSRRQDLLEVFRQDSKVLSLAPSLFPPLPPPPADRGGDFPFGWWWGGPLLFGTNLWDRRPVHAIVSRSLSGEALRRRVSRFRETADEVIEQVRDHGRMELVSEFSTPYVSRVIGCDLAGVPPEIADLALLACAEDQMNHFLAALGLRPMADDELRGLVDRQAHFGRFLADLIEQRHNEPQDDIISDIAPHIPDEVTLAEAVSAVYHLYGAFDQPKLMVGNVVHFLLQEPNRWTALVEDRSLIPSAVEECFRMLNTQPLLQVRTAREDCEIGGVGVPKGQLVCAHAGAANRDPAAYEAPDDYRPGRPDARRSLTFSLGAHGCLGQHVARAYLIAALEAMMESFPGLRLATNEQPVFVPGLFSGVAAVELEWER